MKRIIAYAIMLFLAVGLSSCTKDDLSVNYVPQPTEWSVEMSTQELTSSAAQIEINILGGGNGWWIELPTSNVWCAFNKEMTKTSVYGTGNRKITLYVSENATGMERKLDLVVNPTFNLEPLKFTITQK